MLPSITSPIRHYLHDFWTPGGSCWTPKRIRSVQPEAKPESIECLLSSPSDKILPSVYTAPAATKHDYVKLPCLQMRWLACEMIGADAAQNKGRQSGWLQQATLAPIPSPHCSHLIPSTPSCSAQLSSCSLHTAAHHRHTTSRPIEQKQPDMCSDQIGLKSCTITIYSFLTSHIVLRSHISRGNNFGQYFVRITTLLLPNSATSVPSPNPPAPSSLSSRASIPFSSHRAYKLNQASRAGSGSHSQPLTLLHDDQDPRNAVVVTGWNHVVFMQELEVVTRIVGWPAPELPSLAGHGPRHPCCCGAAYYSSFPLPCWPGCGWLTLLFARTTPRTACCLVP